MLVRDIMNPSVVCVNPDETATVAARLLHRYNVGSLPVCSASGALSGIITDRDIVMRCVAACGEPETTTISEIMSRNVVTVSSTSHAEDAAKLMAKHQVRRLPVVDNGQLVGMLSLGDMARTHACDTEAAEALSEISSNIRKP